MTLVYEIYARLIYNSRSPGPHLLYWGPSVTLGRHMFFLLLFGIIPLCRQCRLKSASVYIYIYIYIYISLIWSLFSTYRVSCWNLYHSHIQYFRFAEHTESYSVECCCHCAFKQSVCVCVCFLLFFFFFFFLHECLTCIVKEFSRWHF